MTTSVQEELNNEASDMRREMRSHGYFFADDMKYHSKFYRYNRNDPYNYVDGAKEYIFITKPDLPILNESGTGLCPKANEIPLFADLFDSTGYREAIFENLCLSYGGNNKAFPFIRILTNRKTSNLDLPDISVEELETAVNMYGTKVIYSKSSLASDENLDFSLDFEDTKYGEIYYLFKVYDMYRKYKDLRFLL